MTDERRQLLNELLAEKKREERQNKKDKEFFAQADARRSELLERWGISTDKHDNFDHIKNISEVTRRVQGG